MFDINYISLFKKNREAFKDKINDEDKFLIIENSNGNEDWFLIEKKQPTPEDPDYAEYYMEKKSDGTILRVGERVLVDNKKENETFVMIDNEGNIIEKSLNGTIKKYKYSSNAGFDLSTNNHVSNDQSFSNLDFNNTNPDDPNKGPTK